MVKRTTPESPSEFRLMTPTEDARGLNNQEHEIGKIQMKKQLGLLEGVAIILGIIFGSGNSLQLMSASQSMFKIKIFNYRFQRRKSFPHVHCYSHYV